MRVWMSWSSGTSEGDQRAGSITRNMMSSSGQKQTFRNFEFSPTENRHSLKTATESNPESLRPPLYSDAPIHSSKRFLIFSTA